MNNGKDIINKKNMNDFDIIDIFYTLIKHFDKNFRISFYTNNHPQKNLIKRFIKLYESLSIVGCPFNHYVRYRLKKLLNKIVIGQFIKIFLIR